MSENEAKAREALKMLKQNRAWLRWCRSNDGTPEPPNPHPDTVRHAKSVLAEFAAEILERNP